MEAKKPNKLVKRKTKGWLHNGTDVTEYICFKAEEALKELVPLNKPLPRGDNLIGKIGSHARKKVNPISLFPSLVEHKCSRTRLYGESTPEVLVKLVSENYIRIKLYDIGKRVTEKVHGQKIRMHLSKCVLHQGQ